MRTQHDLDQAFRDLKRDDEPQPLMSRDDITTLIVAHPIASSTTATSSATSATVRPSRTPWVVGGSLALAATVALVVVNTWDSNGEDEVRVQQPTTHVGTGPSSGDVAAAPETNATGNVSHAPLAEVLSPVGTQKKSSPRLEIETIRLAATQLAPFGLTYSGGSISYIEDARRVTIRANGVATKMDAAVINATTLTPIMVVVYHDEQHFSSWWDKKNTDLQDVGNNRSSQIKMSSVSAVNGLIAIRVPLQATDVLATKVEAVLWFPGTQEVAERLPEQYRSQLLSALGIAQATTSTRYIQPDASGSSLFASSQVFPNPLRTGVATIRLQMKRSASCTGMITDMFGKEIATAWQSQSVSEGQTDLPLLGLDNAPTGVYNVIVTFEGSQERIVQRLMIQR